jgi:hypothetical protein
MRVDDPDEMAWHARTIDEAEGRGDAVHHWLERSDQRLVFENSMGARVASSMWLRLDQMDEAAIAADPALPGMLAAIEERRPPEPGEVMLHLAFAPDGFDNELQRQMTDQLAATCLYAWRAPRLGWVIFCSRHPELYAPVWEYIGFEDAGTRNGYSVWVRDFARYPFADWLTAMIDTELDEAGTLLPPVPSPVALSRADFGPAVRALLRDLHAPDRLRGNPLLDSRLAVPGDPVPTLTQRVQQAVDQLAQAPRLDVAARAIVRTFLRPAGSQDRAAEMLGLPQHAVRAMKSRSMSSPEGSKSPA